MLVEAAAATIKDPQWESVPPWTIREFQKSYPAAALAHGADGNAIVECTVVANGGLGDCKAVQETPAGQGFGEAAVRIVGALHVKAMTVSGNPTAGQVVRAPVRFHLPWSGDDAGGERPVFTVRARLDFKRLPKAEDMARYYPEKAGSLGIEGAADMHCRVLTDGRFADCAITSQAPQGQNFDAATLKLAPLFRVDMTSGLGRLAEGKVIDMPVVWLLPNTHPR